LGYEVVDSDVLVIGAGGAGCRAAIEATEYNVNVVMITKEVLGKAHTVMAEGGYNAVLGNVDPKDSWQWHFYDTLVGGSWINNQKLAETLARESPNRILDLEEYGAVFDRTPEGKIMQRPFGKQTWRRTCYVGDMTGHEILATLVEEVRRRGVKVFDEQCAIDFIMDGGRISGAVALDIKSGAIRVFRSKTTVMTSGGGARIYEITTNAQSDTGDGFAMGYNAGAALIDMEMVQFHPTGMVYPESYKGVLVTEAVRGEGGRLINAQRERFMKRYSPELMELAGRDVVARSIATEILEGRGTKNGGVYLDVSFLPAETIERKLPSMLEQLLNAGVDIRKEPMEIAPTAHHFMGGLLIDEKAATTLAGLYAAGEVTGGVHGGNRLGGNALADTQVFGKIAGENAAKEALKATSPKVNRKQVEAVESLIGKMLQAKKGVEPAKVANELTKLMWTKVGIFRKEDDLKEALKEVRRMENEYLPKLYVKNKATRYNKELLRAIETRNMLITAEAVALAALTRKESRGAQFRRDTPKSNDIEWFVNMKIWREGGEMKIAKVPCVATYIPKPGMKFEEIKW